MKKVKVGKSRGEKRNISLEFLASVSHEIRNPLNVIIGLTHLLKSAESEEEKTRYTNELLNTSQGLLEMVNNILDFSKVNAGKLNYDFKSTDLRASIQQNLAGFKTMAEAKGLDLMVEFSDQFPDNVFTDQVKINQVLLNLISNAVKFTEQGYVMLRVTAEDIADSSATVRFEVQDTGNGIPEEKLDQIFNAFEQGSDEINLKFGGTGLGLSICRKVISKLGGNLQVQSEVEVGTRFFFSLNLPITIAPGSHPIAKKMHSKNTFDIKKKRVLIVDDSELNTFLIKKILKKENFNTMVAHDGMSAMKILQEKKVDLILLDMHMPGMDGMEIAEKIKNLPNLSYIPIIAVTGSIDFSPLNNQETSVFSDFVIKPFHPMELVQKSKAVIYENKTILEKPNIISE